MPVVEDKELSELMALSGPQNQSRENKV